MSICLAVPPIRQQNQMDCWRACVHMILRYYGIEWRSTPGRTVAFDGGVVSLGAQVRNQYHPTSPFVDPLATERGDGPHTRGILPAEFDEMARHYGFRPLSNRVRAWSAAQLEGALRRCGPLWCAVDLLPAGQIVNHVIVVVGIRPNGRVAYNDPAFGMLREMSLDEFNRAMVDAPWNPLYLPMGRNAHGQPVPGHQVRQRCPGTT